MPQNAESRLSGGDGRIINIQMGGPKHSRNSKKGTLSSNDSVKKSGKLSGKQSGKQSRKGSPKGKSAEKKLKSRKKSASKGKGKVATTKIVHKNKKGADKQMTLNSSLDQHQTINNSMHGRISTITVDPT